MKNTQKYIVAGIIVVALVAYLVFTNLNKSSQTPTTDTTDGNTLNGGGNSAPSESTNPAAGGTAPTPTPTPTPAAGAYKDGTYTGPVTDAFYGKVQVVATVSGGKITSVTVPVFPNDPGHTSEVSGEAIPVLKQEAVTAQSSNVQIVSGATQTSQAFQQSLQAALAKAV